MFLRGYAALVAQRAGDEGRDATRLMNTLAVVGTLSGQTAPDQRIWESADINKATWKAYEDLLARVHLSAPIPALSSNVLKRLTSYPKRFLSDTALALTLAGLTAGDLKADPALAGRFVESYVAQQLRPLADPIGNRLWHLRTAGGTHEVDFILDIGSDRYAVEVKTGSQPTAKDTKHLLWLGRELGDRLTASFVVHTGTDVYPLGQDIWALPISQL